MYIKQRYMSREGWRRVIEREYSHRSFGLGGITGEVGLLRLKKVSPPLIVEVCGEPVQIAADGYTWLQIAPSGEHWWLTAMYDGNLNLKQYYFDVTLENHIDIEPYFFDLFLDVSVAADGRASLLDADELDAALAERVITPEQHSLAHQTASRILSAFPSRKAELDRFCLSMIDLFIRAE